MGGDCQEPHLHYVCLQTILTLFCEADLSRSQCYQPWYSASIELHENVRTNLTASKDGKFSIDKEQFLMIRNQQETQNPGNDKK